MNVRLAIASEQPALFELHRSAFRWHIESLWGWDEAWQRENFAIEFAATTTFILEKDGRIAGYIQLMDEDKRIYVQNIALAEDFQGKGLGTWLLKGLQLDAASRKALLQLSVFRTNARAQRFYERLGFLCVGETQTHIEMCWVASQRAEGGDWI